MNQGKVWLVGAGPSDAELLTVKAKRVLEQAEVVVYDRLVGDSILLMMPDTAEKCSDISIFTASTPRLLLHCRLASAKTRLRVSTILILLHCPIFWNRLPENFLLT